MSLKMNCDKLMYITMGAKICPVRNFFDVVTFWFIIVCSWILLTSLSINNVELNKNRRTKFSDNKDSSKTHSH